MHVELTGPDAAPPVLLVHGGGVAGWMWRPTLAALRAPVRAIVPDLPGHGASDDVDYVDHDDAVVRLAAVLEEHAPQGALVVGFSLGAQLAVRLAAEHPRLVRDVVVVSAQARASWMPGPTLALIALAAPLARIERFATMQAQALFVPPALLPEYLEGSRRMRRATLLASVAENLRFRPPEGWARPGPALVVAGTREPRVVRRSAALLAALRPGAALERVEGVGHGLPLQRPDRMAAILEARLGGLEDQPRG